MAKRRHRPVLQESRAAVTSGPIGQPAETEFGPPTKSPCDRSEAKFKHAARAVLGADMVDEHNLTTRPDHANEFVECGFGLWHRCNDKLGHHDIEGSVWQRHPLGVHHGQSLDVAEPKLDDALMRPAHERVVELGLGNVETLAVRDAERMALPDRSFDVVVAQFVITAVPKPEATLNEFVA